MQSRAATVVMVGRLLALAVLYALLARGGLALDAVSGFATLVWPPTGLAIAALMVGAPVGLRLWPGVLLGAFAVNLWMGAPPLAALAIGAGNAGEAVLAVLALRRVRVDPALGRVRDVAALMAVGVATPPVAATVGVTSLWLAGTVPGAAFLVTWRSWWIGDALGALVVAPLLLTWAVRRRAALTEAARGWLEGALLALGTLAAAALVFAGPPDLAEPFRQPFLVFPPVIWAALRFGQRAVTATVALIAAAAVLATVWGLGPYVRPQLHEGLAALQVFMAVVACGGLLLGAVVAERSRAQRALAEAVRVRDEFVSVASHELRTPLSVLSIDLGRLVQLVRREDARVAEAGQVPGPPLGERLGRALRQVERLDGLMENLLDAARIARGQLVLAPERCDLGAIAREVVEAFGSDAERVGCHLVLEAPLPATGRWDRRLVEQAITNLLSNALKYGRGKPILVAVSSGGDSARLEVRDAGIGIPAEDQERIFERFERAVSPRHFGGLGLGLYITRQIALAHGGRVSVTSAAGQGATFLLELPRDSAVTGEIPVTGPGPAAPPGGVGSEPAPS